MNSTDCKIHFSEENTKVGESKADSFQAICTIKDSKLDCKSIDKKSGKPFLDTSDSFAMVSDNIGVSVSPNGGSKHRFDFKSKTFQYSVNTYSPEHDLLIAKMCVGKLAF